MCDRVSVLFGEAVEVDVLVVFFTFRIMEAGTAEEVKVRFDELFSYPVIFVAIRHVCVESTGCRVVNGNGGHDSDTPSLCLEVFGDRGEVR